MEPAALVNAAFWLGLAPWLGGVAVVLLSVPGVIRATNHDDAGPLVAGQVIEALRAGLLRIALPAALFVGFAVVAGLVLGLGRNVGLDVIKLALFAVAAGVLVYDWFATLPALAAARTAADEVARTGDSPAAFDAAAAKFDAAHGRGLTVLQIMLAALLGLALFAALAPTA
jgi:hypothetical protein